MHRRQFLRTLAASTLIPSTIAAQERPGTPAATPQHSGRPRPIVLGDGIELVDYRIFPSPDVRRVIGEIWNTRDDMVDAPVVSMSFPDDEASGESAYASPVTPVLRPGESTMVFGVLPDEIDSAERLGTGTFGLCGPVGSGKYADLYTGLDLSINRDVEDFRPDAVNIQGQVINNADSVAQFTCVRGFIRDHNGRYAGCAMPVNTGHLAPAGSRNFSLWAAETLDVLADPFLLLKPAMNYSVDVIPGLVGPLTAPGCPLF